MPSSDTISCWFLSSFVINWVTCQITGNWHVNQLCIICSILIANWSRDQLCINRSESTGKKFSSLLIDNGSESNLVSSLNNIIDNWSFYSKFFVLAINWPIFRWRSPVRGETGSDPVRNSHIQPLVRSHLVWFNISANGPREKFLKIRYRYSTSD